MTFYFYPYFEKTNPYVANFRAIFAVLGEVRPLPLSIFFAVLIAFKRQKKYAVLNWFEDAPSQVNVSLIRFIQCLTILFIFWLFRVKIIWFKHNLVPHAKPDCIYFKILVMILSKISFKAITHRPYSTFSYVPHPLCSPAHPAVSLAEPAADFFLIFGAVKGYKRISELLRHWPAERSLVILGFCNSASLEAEIKQVIKDRNLLVKWENTKFSDQALDDALRVCRGVVIPNNDTAMLVSGSFYMAASYGKPILMPGSDFSEYCTSVFPGTFTFEFSEGSLASVVSRAFQMDFSNPAQFMLSKSLTSEEIVKSIQDVLST